MDEKIRRLGVRKKYRKNALIFSAGDEARGFFFLLSGEVRVYRMDEKGREVELVRLKPGDFFGEAIAFASGLFPAFARAVRDSETLFFEKDVVFRELGHNPALAKFFLNLLARKCLVLNERIEALSLQTVRQRLAQYLLSRCSGNRNCLVELSLKKAELARLLGTASETLSRNLRAMQKDGLIEVHGRRIQVKNCSALREELSG